MITEVKAKKHFWVEYENKVYSDSAGKIEMMPEVNHNYAIHGFIALKNMIKEIKKRKG